MTSPVTVSLFGPAPADLPVSAADSATGSMSTTDQAVRSTPDLSPMTFFAPVVDLSTARQKKFASVIDTLFPPYRNGRSVFDTALSVALADALAELAELTVDEHAADRMPYAEQWLAEIRQERGNLRRYARWLCHRLGTHAPRGCLRCTDRA